MSDNTENRIRLAEAMGWTDIRCMIHDFPEKSWNDNRCHKFNDHHYCGFPPGQDHFRENIPDPFTDANDDYAVLSFYRNMPHCLTKKHFVDELEQFGGMNGYDVGDYARAALKVLDND